MTEETEHLHQALEEMEQELTVLKAQLEEQKEELKNVKQELQQEKDKTDSQVNSEEVSRLKSEFSAERGRVCKISMSGKQIADKFLNQRQS